MNKAELVDEVAAKTGLTKKVCAQAVDATLSAISDALGKREKVTLVGFGTFSVLQRKARRGRNPQTGKALQIPAKKVPKFAAGKGLKEAVA